MSEELLQTIPQKVGKYTYYRLGSSTLSQLKNHGLIKKKDYSTIEQNVLMVLSPYMVKLKLSLNYKLWKTYSAPVRLLAKISIHVWS